MQVFLEIFRPKMHEILNFWVIFFHWKFNSIQLAIMVLEEKKLLEQQVHTWANGKGYISIIYCSFIRSLTWYGWFWFLVKKTVFNREFSICKFIACLHLVSQSLDSRPSPSVLSMWPCTLKIGLWRKSKYVGLAQENGFSPARSSSCWGSETVHLLEKSVINMIWLLLILVREECNKYDLTAGPCFLIGQS